MAEAEKAIIDILLADAAVTALVGTRVYFATAPQAPVLPYIVMYRISAPRVHSLEGPSGLAAARIQIDMYAKSGASARAVGEAVRVALDCFRDEQSGVNLQCVLLLDEMDGYSEDPELRYVTHDYRVWYNE